MTDKQLHHTPLELCGECGYYPFFPLLDGLESYLMFVCLVGAPLLTYSVKNGGSAALQCMSFHLASVEVGFQGCTVDQQSTCNILAFSLFLIIRNAEKKKTHTMYNHKMSNIPHSLFGIKQEIVYKKYLNY